jgi:hypothetical protein
MFLNVVLQQGLFPVMHELIVLRRLVRIYVGVWMATLGMDYYVPVITYNSYSYCAILKLLKTILIIRSPIITN